MSSSMHVARPMLWINRLFPKPRLADEDDVLFAANEVARGLRLDLQARDFGIEVPVEGAQGEVPRGSGRLG